MQGLQYQGINYMHLKINCVRVKISKCYKVHTESDINAVNCIFLCTDDKIKL